MIDWKKEYKTLYKLLISVTISLIILLVLVILEFACVTAEIQDKDEKIWRLEIENTDLKEQIYILENRR